MNQFLKQARATDLFRDLCDALAAGDGNLLEQTNDQIAEAQIEFLRWALHRAQPRVLIETGTNKGLFAYLVSLLLENVELHTFDQCPESRNAVEILNQRQTNVRCIFHEGDTRATLPKHGIAAQFAWIDGGHATDVVLSDLLQCYRLGVTYVAVDYTSFHSVRQAVDYMLSHVPYETVPNPFAELDQRGTTLLRLTQQATGPQRN